LGLDTTAFRSFEPLPGHPDEYCDEDGPEDGEGCYERGHEKVFAYADFPHALDGFPGEPTVSETWGSKFIEKGWVKIDRDNPVGSTHASYSGHGIFRDLLRAAGGWPETADKWDLDVEQIKDLPFFELIWFADNEGTLGPVACAALVDDFEKYRENFIAVTDSTRADWWISLYDDWAECVKGAANTGFIDFH